MQTKCMALEDETRHNMHKKGELIYNKSLIIIATLPWLLVCNSLVFWNNAVSKRLAIKMPDYGLIKP